MPASRSTTDRARLRLILGLIAVVVLATGCSIEIRARELPASPIDDPPMAAVEPSSFFGINGQALRGLVYDPGADELEQLDRQLAYLPGGGIDFVRADVDWRSLQPEPPTGDPQPPYQLSDLDLWVEALAEHRIRWQPVLALFVPEWAADPDAPRRCGSRSAPAEAALDDYARAFAAVADRYGRDGSFWAERDDLRYLPIVDYEVWNEPNHHGFWCPRPDPERYARLYAKAQQAIRAVDPRARILFGGLSDFREDDGPEGEPTRQSFAGFIEDSVAALPAGSSIDVLAAHAYGPPARIGRILAEFRSTLDRLDLEQVPIAFNEFGWSRGGDHPTSEQDRTRFIDQLTRALAANDCRVISIAPHTWVTAEQNPGDHEDFFGLADPASGAPYESGAAYLRIARALGDRARPRGRPTGICRPAGGRDP